MLGLLSDPLIETTPDDSEAVILGVPEEGGPTLLETFELVPVTCREECGGWANRGGTPPTGRFT